MRPHRTVAACLLLLGCVTAQTDLERLLHPPTPRFDLGPTLQALARHVRDTADADRTVATVSWQMLAFLANRSTLRMGPQRQELKTLASWLRSAQGKDGWYAPGGVRCSRFDQALATYANRVAGTISDYTLLHRYSKLSGDALLAAFAVADAAPASAEEAALLALLAQAFAQSQRDTNLAPRLQELARVQATPLTFGRSRRADAALHVAQGLLGADQPADLTDARTWPADLATDPLHSYFAMVAMGPHRAQLARHVGQLEQLLATRCQAADEIGTWPAAAGGDRITTSAMLATVLSMANASLPPADAKASKPK